MDYAVIRTGGKQYRVSPGDIIRTEKLAGDAGAPVAFTDVLMTSAGGAVRVGSPVIGDVRVTGLILQQGKAKKILVYKKKKRKNYRRHHGHRQLETTVRVTAIEIGEHHGA